MGKMWTVFTLPRRHGPRSYEIFARSQTRPVTQMQAAADREAADRCGLTTTWDESHRHREYHRDNPNAGREDLVHVGRGTVFHDNDAHEKER